MMEEILEKPFGIKLNLDKDFVNSFKYLCRKYGETFKILNGFSDSQLNYTDFIDNFVKEDTIADVSIDGNANVGSKDIVSLQNEMSKPHSKLLAFNKLFYELKKKYGLQTAREWMEAEWNGDFYMHDAFSSTFLPYCYAYDLELLVTKGLFFIKGFNALPPQHLLSYVDFVAEFISYCCNRSSGAVGLPSFLVYCYYFWKKDIDSNYLGLKWEDKESIERYREQAFQSIIYKLNQPFLRSGIQSAFTNFSIFDQSYFEALFGGKTFPDGSFMIDIEDDFMEFQKAFMEICSKIRSINMMTFPVLTISLLKDKKTGKFLNEDFAKWACKHNMKWGDSNFFISSDVTSLSNCCRLKSNIQDLGYFNSIGGTALEVGSVKVNTINLAKIAYETNSKEGYLKKLKEKIILNLKSLDIVRTIIKRNIDKGLLLNYIYGLMHLENQYNTIGIIGIYEALQKFNLTEKDILGNTSYTKEGIEFAKDILNTIHTTKEEFKNNYNCDYMINVEQIPGERAASILMEKDKKLFPNEAYELPLYGNQWIPLGVKCTLDEKIKLSAILDEACNGGSIAHINLEAPLTDFDTAWELLNYVADKGVTYFAFNLRISACKENHGFFGETCPICGGKKETTYQRIVGFLTPLKTRSSQRSKEFSLRTYYQIDSKNDLM